MNYNDLIQQYLIPVFNSVGYGGLLNGVGAEPGPYTMIVRPVIIAQRVNFNATFTARELYDNSVGVFAGAIPPNEIEGTFIGIVSVSNGLGNTSANDATAVMDINMGPVIMPVPQPALPNVFWETTRFSIPGNANAAAIYATQSKMITMWNRISITPAQPGNTNEVSLVGALVTFKKNF